MTNDDASTILVVEDDDATRSFLADNLSADGYDLLVADCATDALGLLERKFPDLALVDLNLPDASGFELLRRVRASDGIASRVDPDTPLMVLSGRSSELDRVRGFDRGADDYLCKPFSYPELWGLDFMSPISCRAPSALGRLVAAACWRPVRSSSPV